VSVWAFGVTIMEIINRGDPYPGIPDEMVAVRVRDTGFHPQLTSDTPDILADVLESCWAMNPDDRSTFSQVCNALDSLNRGD
jgi:Protein tyrosine and serine/threonine kinase